MFFFHPNKISDSLLSCSLEINIYLFLKRTRLSSSCVYGSIWNAFSVFVQQSTRQTLLTFGKKCCLNLGFESAKCLSECFCNNCRLQATPPASTPFRWQLWQPLQLGNPIFHFPFSGFDGLIFRSRSLSNHSKLFVCAFLVFNVLWRTPTNTRNQKSERKMRKICTAEENTSIFV